MQEFSGPGARCWGIDAVEVTLEWAKARGIQNSAAFDEAKLAFRVTKDTRRGGAAPCTRNVARGILRPRADGGVITTIGAEPARGTDQLIALTLTKQAGEPVSLTYQRQGQSHDTTVTLGSQG